MSKNSDVVGAVTDMSRADKQTLNAILDGKAAAQKNGDTALYEKLSSEETALYERNGMVATSAPGSVPAGGTGSGGRDNSGYLKEQYAAQLQSELAGLKGAYDKALAGYNAAQEALPGQYQGAKNAAAAQNAQEKRAFDERSSAAGLSNGANAQAQLAMSGALQAQMGNLDRDQAEAFKELELKKADLKSDYETALAVAAASGRADLASALYQEMIRVQGLEREDEQTAMLWNRQDQQLQKQWERDDAQQQAEWDREDAQLAAKESAAERDLARKIALEYGLVDPKNIGSINSLADLAALGVQVPAAGGTGTGGGGTGGFDNGGLESWKVRTMQRYFGLTADGMWGANSQGKTGMSAQQAWAAYQNSVARSSISFDEDEGTISWNGKTYTTTDPSGRWISDELLADLDAADLTKEEISALNKQMKPYGIELAAD